MEKLNRKKRTHRFIENRKKSILTFVDLIWQVERRGKAAVAAVALSCCRIGRFRHKLNLPVAKHSKALMSQFILF